MTEKENITELINRYEEWLKKPFVPTKYYPSKEKWELLVINKIAELKKIKNVEKY